MAEPVLNSSLTQISFQVDGLKLSFRKGLTRTIAWRVHQLQQVKKMLQEQQSQFYKALALDLHKSEQEAWVSEIGFVISEVDHTLKYLNQWSQPRKVSTPLIAQPAKSYSLAEPLGTVLIISAWNYPIQLVLAPLVAAIAAGNCVVIKPSEVAEYSGSLLAELLPQYLDVDCIQVISGAIEETTELLKQSFDHIFYTGGEAVAKIIMRAAAEHLTPVTLELGGKSPCIVDSQTNVEMSAARIVWSKWMNAGQTCVAPDYVLVEASFAENLIRAITSKIESFYGQNPESSQDYGRIINTRHFDRLVHYLEGENVVYGGQFNRQNQYLAPTIILSSNNQSPIMQEEIFGPILVIKTVKVLDDAIDFINSKPKPLALYLYTNDRSFEAKVVQQTSSGNVGINDGMMFMANPNLPFGGVGGSGMGRYHGQAGFNTFSHLKTIMKRRFLFDVALRYPPFSYLKLRILKKLL
ncbi:aldehyde dehydrogenase family protein [Marinomonas sp. 15G1-11]|uniref:Aldehyde dehydrogenase n=1 Tax=Marinomonas phaeophyticola TaxID=3004091 RepID=A0ABT4JVZ0_9GAMM|nr:aldehyde dehydrogenase family protein [Marinomonas sp. 15G1-11]MCZ2722545.1 aldehyde dehydrogenase family protein [Marinomonas sp. 15G1-11]